MPLRDQPRSLIGAVRDVNCLTLEAVDGGSIGGRQGTFSSNNIDAFTATTLSIAPAVATALELGASDITTTSLGPVEILSSIDTTGASAMTVGAANATSLSLGASDITTTNLGNFTIDGDLTVDGTTITANSADFLQLDTSGSADYTFLTFNVDSTAEGTSHPYSYQQEGTTALRLRYTGAGTANYVYFDTGDSATAASGFQVRDDTGGTAHLHVEGNGDVVIPNGSLGVGVAAGGTPSNTLDVNGTANISGASTLVGNTTVGDGSGGITMEINGSAAQNRVVQFTTGGSRRWAITTDAGAESGGNAGSTLRIGRYNDGGSLVDNTVSIDRPTGNVTLLGNMLVDDVDTNGAAAMTVGSANATSLSLGASDITTTVLGATEILGSIDTTGGVAMTVGPANATALNLGASDITTTVLGATEILGSIDTTGAVAMTVGPANATALNLGALDIVTSTVGKGVAASGNITGTPAATGSSFEVPGTTFTDNNTAGSGTAAVATFSAFTVPTLAATNASVTTTDAATVYIAGVPAAGTNQTITNAYALWVDAGEVRLDGELRVTDIDTLEAGAALNIGASGATSIEISDTGVTTNIQGPLTCAETLVMTGQLTTDGWTQKTQAITSATDTLTISDSGQTIFLNTASNNVAVTLPAPTAGAMFKFVCTNATNIGSAISPTASTMKGTVVVAGAAVSAGAADEEIHFDSGSSIGDWFYLVSDGTNYYASGAAGGATGITFQST